VNAGRIDYLGKGTFGRQDKRGKDFWSGESQKGRGEGKSAEIKAILGRDQTKQKLAGKGSCARKKRKRRIHALAG